MCTSVSGKTIWHMDKDSIRVSMAPSIMEIGSMMSNMASVRRYGLMEASTRAIMSTVKSTDMENSLGLTARHTKVISLTTKYVAKAITNGPTRTSIGALGREVKCMVKGSTRSPMDDDTSESL